MDKAVIFIVEGATDKKSLENIFKKIYRYKEIHFEFTHGDITCDEGIDKGNVETEIYNNVFPGHNCLLHETFSSHTTFCIFRKCF